MDSNTWGITFTALIVAAVIAAVVMRSHFPRSPPQPRESRPGERSDLDSRTAFRLHVLPNSHDIDLSRLDEQVVQKLIREAFSIDPDLQIYLKSLSAHPLRNALIATLSFSKIPERILRTSPEQQDFPGDGVSRDFSLDLDVHFNGFTPFHSRKTIQKDLDIIALSGLNGHPFGSFKHKGGNFMWLRDDLPLSMPTCRIFVYGYDTKLLGSHSFQSLEDLGISFKSALLSLYKANRKNGNLKPLVLLGHSLGGLVLKEALCKLSGGETADDKAVLKSVQGILFFGTPNQGMDITSLIPMAEGNANEDFLRSLGRDSPDLRRQAEQWSKRLDSINNSAASHSLRIISYYETVESPTAVLVGDQWKMNGTQARLVDRSSATHGRSWETSERYVSPINRSHSDMVKFHGRNDPIYAFHVLPQLQDLLRIVDHPVEVIFTDLEKACLSSLGFPEQHSRFDQIAEGAKNTCMWLLKHQKYIGWHQGEHSLLWLEGHPGSGKSTLMKHAVEAMTNETDRCSLIATFFFHSRGVELQKTSLGFFRSLTYQLLMRFPVGLAKATSKFLEMKKHPKWQIQWLRAFLKRELSIACKDQHVVIFVDALDECDSQEITDVADFLTDITSSTALSSLRICVSCRHYPNLFTGGSRLTVEGHNNGDITKFIQSRLSMLPESKRSQIGNDIVANSRGIFQWAQLVCHKALWLHRKGQSILAIQREVRSTPKELHDLYQRLFEDIDKMDLPLTWRLFQWVCFAQGPLTVRELQYALMLSWDMKKTTVAEVEQHEEFRFELNDMLNSILDLSKGLIELLPGSDLKGSASHYSTDISSKSTASSTVKYGPSRPYDHTWNSQAQLIHQSVLDYFQASGFKELERKFEPRPMGHINATPEGRGHWFISRSAYKFLEAFKGDQRLEESNIPLFSYATDQLYQHIIEVERQSIDQADILDMFGWPYNRNAMRREFRPSYKKMHLLEMHIGEKTPQGHQIDEARTLGECFTLLHLGVELELHSVVRSIIKREFPMADGAPASINPLNSTLPHPFNVDERQEILIDGRWNTNIFDFDRGVTALHVAVKKCRVAAAREILQSPITNPNVQDRGGQTPLHWATTHFRDRHGAAEMIAQALLQHPRIEPDLQDGRGQTPFFLAVHHDHVNAGVLQQLLKRNDVLVNAKDRVGNTVLVSATRHGRVKVVRLLLNSGRFSDGDIQDTIKTVKKSIDSSGRWHSAVEDQKAATTREKCLQMLLEMGAVREGKH